MVEPTAINMVGWGGVGDVVFNRLTGWFGMDT